MTSHAKELDKFYNEIKSHGNTEIFLDNACRVSAPLAARLLKQMGIGEDTSTPFKLFENACGVGVVTPLLQQLVKPSVLKSSSFLCGDFSEPVIEVARQRSEIEGWVNTEVRKIDGQKNGLDDGAFTHVATNIGFHVIPDSEAALNEAIRILQPGGILGFTTWHKEPGWMTEVKDAVKKFPFEAPLDGPLQTTTWGDWTDVNWLRKTLEAKGLQDVKVDVYAFLSRCDGPDYFIAQFGLIVDALLMGSWPEELRKAHPKEEVLKLLKEHLTKKYGGEGWDLSWVATVATGRVP